MTAQPKKVCRASYIRAAMRRGFDTASIASMCSVSEAAVWNALSADDAKRSAPVGARDGLAPLKGSPSQTWPGGSLPGHFLGAVVSRVPAHAGDIAAREGEQADLIGRSLAKAHPVVAGLPVIVTHQELRFGASKPHP